MSIERAQAIAAEKREAITQADIIAIQDELLLAPADQAHEAARWIWEGVALTINNPDYRGDAKLPE